MIEAFLPRVQSKHFTHAGCPRGTPAWAEIGQRFSVHLNKLALTISCHALGNEGSSFHTGSIAIGTYATLELVA